MSDLIRKQWPVVLASLILLAVTSQLLRLSLQKTGGHLIYALDDAYIHMAMAKHFAQDHVWGITRYEFSSSSSSPLWTLLISFTYLVFGVNDIAPLILTVLSAVLTLVIVCRLMDRYKVSQPVKFLVLLSIAFAAPLPSLIFIGQEHILHIPLMLAFVSLSAEVLSEKSQESSLPVLCILSALLTSVRYESVFVIAVVCLLFAIKRRWRYTVLIAAGGFLPIAIYGIISKSYGWYFLPNSVAVKGSHSIFSHWNSPHSLVLETFAALKRLQRVENLCAMLVFGTAAGLFHLRKGGWVWTRNRIMLFIFLVITALHALFARFGHFYRYEAYLIVVGTFILWLLLVELLKRDATPGPISRYALPVVISLLILASVGRGVMISMKVPKAVTNIYEQQYQMAMFVKRFYNGKTIALNDIGAVNYYADVKCADLAGLASRETASKILLNGGFTTTDLEELTRSEHLAMAIVYDKWLGVVIPVSWPKAGEWTIHNNVVAGDDTVSFYSCGLSEGSELSNSFRKFSSELPADVETTAY